MQSYPLRVYSARIGHSPLPLWVMVVMARDGVPLDLSPFALPFSGKASSMKEVAVVLLTLVGTIAALMAAMFWLTASLIVVPSHIGRLNALASGAAGVSAVCAFALWVIPH